MIEKIKRLYTKISRSSEPRIIALAYHRVDKLETDPWQLAVSPENFKEQLKIIKKDFILISIEQLIEQVITKNIKENQVVITFDDAYSDNFRNAKSILEEHDCAATFFVPTAYIDQQREFWSDELERIILHTQLLPLRILLKINNLTFKFKLEKEELSAEDVLKHSLWSIPNRPPTDRCQLYYNLWKFLMPLKHEEINLALDSICSWANSLSAPNSNSFPMSSLQLRKLNENNLFSLGIHTNTHPALANHERKYQYLEINSCKNTLKTDYSADIKSIAYPYGSYNRDTIISAKKENISVGFSSRKESITKSANNHALGRFQVLNWNGDSFKLQLEDWFANY